MIISVASGKGGTGKTTVATCLAAAIENAVYMDCDVEEPNGHILLHPEFSVKTPSQKMLPKIDYSKCTFCGKCVEVCEYNALINLKTEIMLFDGMCHGCGACTYFCPEKAITEIAKTIGYVREGDSRINNIKFYDGVLNIGEEMATPLIKSVKAKMEIEKTTIIDSPPGTSCSMVESVKDSDFCILVTESTPFGLHDLQLAIELLKIIDMPYGVVINKYDKSFVEMEDYFDRNGIEVLLKIPFDRKIAESYSKGILPIIDFPEFKNEFVLLYNRIKEKLEMENVNA